MREIVYGRNAVRESLRAGRRHVHKIILADNLDQGTIIADILALAQKAKRPVHRVSRKELDRVGPSHQGVAMEVGSYPIVDIDTILERSARLNEPPFILALDHLEDPQNLGAILRTAEIVGVHGVLIPKRRAVSVTPAVVNASAGAAEHMWIAEVSNLVQSLNRLKQENVWLVGVENTPASLAYNQADLTGAITLVVGSEGKGLSRLVRETCDFMVRLPMRGRIESLNASVACALALYEVWRARGFQEFEPS